jgi:hypothetical protein
MRKLFNWFIGFVVSILMAGGCDARYQESSCEWGLEQKYLKIRLRGILEDRVLVFVSNGLELRGYPGPYYSTALRFSDMRALLFRGPKTNALGDLELAFLIEGEPSTLQLGHISEACWLRLRSFLQRQPGAQSLALLRRDPPPD